MPNQLAQSKKRMTVAEERAVLAALEVIAEVENSTVTNLIRQAVRKAIAERVDDPRLKKTVRQTVAQHAPKVPIEFRSAAKVSKFKREQREYDQLLQELKLADPEELQLRN